MFVVRAAAGGCGRQQVLRQNHSCSQARTVGTVAAFSDAIEPVAGGDDPCVGGGALQVLAEVLECRGVFRGKGSKVVDRFIDAGCQACGCHIVAQDSPIHHLREESRLRMSSRIRCGMFSCPSGAKVSWSRAPPPKVMTTTFRLLVEIPVRAIRLEGSRELPSATPAALRKNSRRLQASCRASSWGADAPRGGQTSPVPGGLR